MKPSVCHRGLKNVVPFGPRESTVYGWPMQEGLLHDGNEKLCYTKVKKDVHHIDLGMCMLVRRSWGVSFSSIVKLFF